MAELLQKLWLNVLYEISCFLKIIPKACDTLSILSNNFLREKYQTGQQLCCYYRRLFGYTGTLMKSISLFLTKIVMVLQLALNAVMDKILKGLDISQPQVTEVFLL